MSEEGVGMLISLKEYAERHGKNPDNMRQKANRGKFKTAVRIGRDWVIDEDEPFEDSRIKSGKYVDWKYKHKRTDAVQKTAESETKAAQGAEEEQAKEAEIEAETEE